MSDPTFGNGGFVTFGTQADAESYLVGLPHPYTGRTVRTGTGWAVSYRISKPLDMKFSEEWLRKVAEEEPDYYCGPIAGVWMP